MVNFGPLAAEIDPVVWGIPANFNGFRLWHGQLHHQCHIQSLIQHCSLVETAMVVTTEPETTTSATPTWLKW